MYRVNTLLGYMLNKAIFKLATILWFIQLKFQQTCLEGVADGIEVKLSRSKRTILQGLARVKVGLTV